MVTVILDFLPISYVSHW